MRCLGRVSGEIENSWSERPIQKPGGTDVTIDSLLVGLDGTRASSTGVLPVGARVELNITRHQENNNPSGFTLVIWIDPLDRDSLMHRIE